MNNLLKIGISKETIDKMLETDESRVVNLNFNYKEVQKRIQLLKDLNIIVIDDLLINYPHIFSHDIERLTYALHRFNSIEENIKHINENPGYILQLLYADEDEAY